MIQAIQEAGCKNEIIWQGEEKNIIDLECEDHDLCNAKLRATEVCKKSDIEMAPRFAEEPVFAEKIFDLNHQLEGGMIE